MPLPAVAGLTAWEYERWLDYFDRRPPLEEVVPQQLATLCALVYNALRGKNDRPKTADDFMWWVKKKDASSVEDGEQAQAPELTFTPADEEKLLAALQGESDSSDSSQD